MDCIHERLLFEKRLSVFEGRGRGLLLALVLFEEEIEDRTKLMKHCLKSAKEHGLSCTVELSHVETITL